MHRIVWVWGLLSALSSAGFARADDSLQNFITVQGDQLMDGNRPFRFISFDIPNLQLIEDNLPFTQTNPWRLPDRFELQDGLASVRQLGGTVVRTYVLSVVRTNDTPDMPRHVLGPNRFNEEAFRSLDLALQIANQQGVRLIIPLVDNWIWNGGRAEYAGFRGKSREAFWTDPQLIADFKETIRFVLTRTNSLTGTPYCEDKAILCWETGNEIAPPLAWTREIARTIKRIDTNHLVMDGVAFPLLQPDVLDTPEIDIVTTHHYPSWRATNGFAWFIRENWARAKGRKPYVVGEFGFVSTDQMEEAMKAILETGTSGGLLWSLRFHDRDGGFYWHSEPSGGNRYKGFHWPGFSSGALYDEAGLLSMVRRYAYAIRGLTPPALPAPPPPRLLPIPDASSISWQGSVGAASYDVQRAPRPGGPWSLAGSGIDDTTVQYRPLFNDESAPAGNWYYRVLARNPSGISPPSNVAGPVAVTNAVRVDELADFSRVQTVEGHPEIKTRDCRRAKEDAHRASGQTGDALVYLLPAAIQSFRVYTFSPGEIADLKFSTSTDGKTYADVRATRSLFPQDTGDYSYLTPALYQANLDSGPKYLRIEWTGPAQIGRVEIVHALPDSDAGEAATPGGNP